MIFIDFYILAQMMYFDLIRKPFNLAIASVVGNSLNYTRNNLQALFSAVKYDLSFTGQTIYIEHYLNDVYDNTLRRIYIKDTDAGDETYIFNESEGNEEIFLFNDSEGEPDIYLENNSETISAIHFEVFVPNDVVFNPIVFRKHVEKYAISGFNFQIVIV